MASERRHSVLRVIAAIFVFLLLVTGGTFLWLNHSEKHVVRYKVVTAKGETKEKEVVKEEPNYKDLLKKMLPEFMEKATNGMYHLSVADITVDIPANEIAVKGLSIWPDTLLIRRKLAAGGGPSHTWRVSIPAARITDVKWLSLITDKALLCGQMLITKPVFVITRNRDITGEHTGDNEGTLGDLQKISFARIMVQEPVLTYRISDGVNSSYHLSGGSITLNNWMVGNKPNDNTGPFFYAKSGNIRLGTLEYKRPGLLYKINSSGVAFETDNNTLRLTNLRIEPLLEKEDYYKRMGVQKEMYTVHLPVIEFRGFNWKQLTGKNTLYASSLYLGSPRIDIYLSRFPPPNTQSRLETFPHQLLMRLKTKVNIPKVDVSGGYVKYTELNNKNNLAGTSIFNDIHGAIANVTNMPAVLKKNSHCTARLSGKYKGKSDITTNWNLNLSDPSGSYSMNGTLTNMDAADISDDAKALSMVAIRSLHIDKMDVSVHGNNATSSGTFTMLYNNLEVELEKINKQGNIDDKDASTWMANHIYIFKQNPMPDDVVRTVTTSVPHDRMRSFFSSIWANMREGVDKTVIKDQQLAENRAKITDGSDHKKGVIKALFKSIFRKKAK